MLVRPLVRSVVSPLVRGVTQRTRGRYIAPSPVADHFAAGEQGWIWDNSRLDTMWQDSAKTIPAVVGQEVRYQLDLSGRGNHRYQPTAGKGLILRLDANGKYYLEGNGTSRWMVTVGPVNLSAVNKATFVVGVRKISDAATQMLLELSASSDSNAGGFYFAGSLAAAANFEVNLGSTAGRSLARSGTTYPAGTNYVHAVSLDRSAGTASAQVVWTINDSVPTRVDSGAMASGNFGSHEVYTFARGGASLFSSGRDYGSVLRGGSITAGQLTQLKAYINGLTGAY